MAPADFTSPPQAPRTFSATAESILADSKRIREGTRALLDRLVATVSPEAATFENVLRPIAEDENQRLALCGVLDIYQKVSTDRAIREASSEAEREMSHFMIDCLTREDVFRLVDAVFHKNEPIPSESQKFLREERRTYMRNGLALTQQADKDRLKEIRKRLSTISNEFGRNLDEEDQGIWLAPEELQGTPNDTIGGLDVGTGNLEGKLKVPFHGPEFTSVMQFAESEETRKKIFIKSEENQVPFYYLLVEMAN